MIQLMNRLRALFVLPSSIKPAATAAESVGGGDNLGGYILRLETAFYELAQNYYHQVVIQMPFNMAFNIC